MARSWNGVAGRSWLNAAVFTQNSTLPATSPPNSWAMQTYTEKPRMTAGRILCRVRFLLYGINGRLRWRDIQVGGNVKPAGSSDDDPVEFSAPIGHTP